MRNNKELYNIFVDFRGKQIFLCCIISFQIILAACIPFLIRNFINSITNNVPTSELVNIIFALIGLTVLNVIVSSIQNYYWHKLRLQSVNYLRLQMFKATLKKNKSFFDHKSIGEILALILDDVSIVAQNIVIGFPMLFCNILNIVVVLGVLMVLNVKLSIIVLLAIPFYIIWFHHLNKKVRQNSILERESYSNVMKDAQEKLQGIDTIKIFTKEAFMIQSFHKKLDTHFKFIKRNLLYNNLSSGLNNLIISLLPVIILSYGSILINSHMLSIGALMGFFAYISYIYEPLSNLSDYILGLQNSLAAGKKIINFLKSDLMISTQKNYIKQFESLEFRNVSFKYNHKDDYVLRNLNFLIRKGDHVGLIGKSGCGKTTFLKLILGMYPVTEGEILINNININDINIDSLFNMFSIQEQNLFIFDGTLIQNLTFNSESNLEITNMITALTFVSEICSYEKNISLNTLSGGQKQRICMARALLKNYDFLILDEPTSFLDSSLEDNILNNLKQLTSNKTILIVTHKPRLLEDCNIILDLESEKISKNQTKTV